MGRLVTFVIAAVLVIANSAHGDSAPAPTVGAVEGVVSDAATREALPGVTVVASSPVLAGTQSELKDSDGTYRIDGLPPGNYEVTFFYADIKIRRQNVEVQAGKTTPVTIQLNPSAAGGTVVVQKVTSFDDDDASLNDVGDFDAHGHRVKMTARRPLHNHHALDDVPPGRVSVDRTPASPAPTEKRGSGAASRPPARRPHCTLRDAVGSHEMIDLAAGCF